MGVRRGALIALGEGVYTVPEIARILQPTMNQSKLRYWLDEGLLGEPIRRGSRGRSHLLSFRQLLQARTIQHLRDTLEFPLQKVRPVIREISDLVFPHLFNETSGREIKFIKTPREEIGVYDGFRTYELATGQQMLSEAVIPELNEILTEAKRDWESAEVPIKRFPHLVSSPRIMAGSPIIRGSRIETSAIAYLSQNLGTERVLELYPQLEAEEILEAARFEGAAPLAAV